jgi:methylase of polypeptide subunit release factors
MHRDTARYLHYMDAFVIQVDEMEKAVDVAEKNMNRFGLTTQEIRSRRSWVHDTRRTVRQHKNTEVLD